MHKYIYSVILFFLLTFHNGFGNISTALFEIETHDKTYSILHDSVKVVELRAYGTDLSYDVTHIEAKAGQKLTIRFINESDMPHNVVVVKGRDDINTVGIAALNYSKNDYIPEEELDKIVAHTVLARPGESVEVTFTVPPPGTYPYICTYPGHFTSMRGELISTE